jgi:LPXTG-motif cell wall-anchored protein
MVLSVPARLAGAAAAPGAVTVDGPTGTPLAATVSALRPSQTAVVILVHTAGAPPDRVAAVNGTAAELIHSLEPDLPVAVVSTTAGAVLAPLSVDRGAVLAALAQPVPDGPLAMPEALRAAAGQLAGPGLVDPMVVLVDGASATGAATLPTDLPSLAGIEVRVIPVGPAPSPLVALLADRLHLSVATGADPVALVDAAAGALQGRIQVVVPDPGAGVVAVHLRSGADDLTATVALAAPAAPTSAAVAPPPAPTTVPTVLAERSSAAGPADALAPSATGSSSRPWLPLVAGLAVLGAGGMLVARRRRGRGLPADGATSGGPDGPVQVVNGFYYTDFSDPLSSARSVVPGPSPSAPPPSAPAAAAPSEVPVLEPVPDRGNPPPLEPELDSPLPAAVHNGTAVDNGDDRKVRVLALAEELGNISEACRIVGVSRRSYYEWKRIADAYGIDALTSKRAPRPSR